jgi:uncharacterized protein (TIGR02145 family)
MFACSSTDKKTDNSEKLSNFLSNFKTLQVPLSAVQIKQQGTIENKFLDILTDTTGGFSSNYPDGKIHFTDEYHYIGKIEQGNKNFHIIIAEKTPTAAVLGLMDGALLETSLYTISTDGKIISEIPFAYFSEEENWGMTASVNENLEIETKLDKTIKKYKIEEDGKIKVVSESEEETNNEPGKAFLDFIAESYKAGSSGFNSERTSMANEGISDEQISFIANEYIPNIDELVCYKPVVFEMPGYTVILLTYRDNANELANIISVDKNGKIISEKKEVYYFGERAEEGSIEIKPADDNTMTVLAKIVHAKQNGSEKTLNTTLNYYKIDENGKLKKAEAPLTFTDNRDGKTYKIVKIGAQVWLAENFRHKPENGKYGGFDGNYWAYDEEESNIAKYGYLYDHATALKIAPKGWHLPTKEEFETLVNNYGDKAFEALTKQKDGLNVVYGGWFYEESMAFVRKGDEVGFWSASEQDKDNAWLCIFEREYKHVFIRTRFKAGVGASVRLVQDEEVF